MILLRRWWWVLSLAVAHVEDERLAFVSWQSAGEMQKGGGHKKPARGVVESPREQRSRVVSPLRSSPMETSTPFAEREDDLQWKALRLERELRDLSLRLSAEERMRSTAAASLKTATSASRLAGIELSTLEARLEAVEKDMQVLAETAAAASTKATLAATRALSLERDVEAFKIDDETSEMLLLKESQRKIQESEKRQATKEIDSVRSERDNMGLKKLMALQKQKIALTLKSFERRLLRLKTKEEPKILSPRSMEVMVLSSFLGYASALKEKTAAARKLLEAQAELRMAAGDLYFDEQLSKFAVSASEQTKRLVEEARINADLRAEEMKRSIDFYASKIKGLEQQKEQKEQRQRTKGRTAVALLTVAGIAAAKRAFDFFFVSAPTSTISSAVPVGATFAAAGVTGDSSLPNIPPAAVPAPTDAIAIRQPDSYGGGGFYSNNNHGDGGGGGNGGGGGFAGGGFAGVPPLIEAAAPMMSSRGAPEASRSRRRGTSFFRGGEGERMAPLSTPERTVSGGGFLEQLVAKAFLMASALSAAFDVDTLEGVVDCGARFVSSRNDAAVKRTMDRNHVQAVLLTTTTREALPPRSSSSDSRDSRFAEVGDSCELSQKKRRIAAVDPFAYRNTSRSLSDILEDCGRLPLIVSKRLSHLRDALDANVTTPVVVDLAATDATLWPAFLEALLHHDRRRTPVYATAPTSLLADPASAKALRSIGPNRLLWASGDDSPLDDHRKYKRNLQEAKHALDRLFSDYDEPQRRVLRTNAEAVFPTLLPT